MRTGTLFLCILLTVSLTACAMARHKKCVREGLLVVGLNRKAFLKVWGNPDHTEVMPSDEITQVGGSFSDWSGGFNYFKGRVPLDVWYYYDRQTVLVFNGLRLLAWETAQTQEEIEMKRNIRGPVELDGQLEVGTY